jgi:hypothetical protein
MARPTTFDYSKALQLYNLIKTDEEISQALKIPRSTVSSWRQRNKLKANEVKQEERKQHKPRPTYKQAIEPHRIPDLETFLHALEGAWDKCKREGVKPNMSECIEVLRHR